MPTERSQDEVLTLHRDVLARVEPALRASRAQDFLHAVGKADRMMAHLAGLNSALSGFSAQAWAMATAIVESPALCARLGMGARILRLDELADLVQVVLEEEELHAVELTGNDANFQPLRVPQTQRPQSTQTIRPRKVAAQGRAVGVVNPALKRQVQSLLREVKRTLGADAEALQRPQVGSADPAPVGPFDLDAAQTLAVAGPAGGAAPGQPMRLSPESAERFRAAAQRSSRRLDATGRAAFAGGGATGTSQAGGAGGGSGGISRALRLNEAATELAFLAPGVEIQSEAPSRGDDGQASVRDGSGGARGTPGRGRTFPAPFLADRVERLAASSEGVPSGGVPTVADAAAADARNAGRPPAAAQRPTTVRARAPHAGLAAAVAQAAVAERQARALARMAVPRAGGTGLAADVGVGADRATARLGEMAPRWLQTLSAWVEADGPTVAQRWARGSTTAVRLAAGGPVPKAATSPRAAAAVDEVFVSLAPTPEEDGLLAVPATRTTARAGTPAWLKTQGVDRQLASAHAVAGPVGLRASALVRDLVARHAGGLDGETAGLAERLPAATFAAWRSPRSGYHASETERATLQLADSKRATPDSAAFEPPAAGQRPAVSVKPAWAAAAGAAVAAVVSRARAFAVRAARAPAARPNILDFAHAQPDAAAIGAWRAVPSILSAKPAGRVDALTPSLAAAERRVGLSPALAPRDQRAWLESASTEATVARAVAASAESKPRSRLLAAGASDALVPAALRAALAVFGERVGVRADPSVAGAYLARFFGASLPVRSRTTADPERAIVRLAADIRADVEAAVPVSGAHRTSGRSGGVPSTSRADAVASPAEPVLRGLAALEALMAGPGATDALLGQAAARELRAAAADQTLLEPAAESLQRLEELTVGAAPAPATSSRAAAHNAAWPSAQIHRFAPVGLGRGRGLLARAKAAESGSSAPLSARSTNARPSGAASWTARRAVAGGETSVGYGAAALGGGELLGLTGGDSADFFGEALVTPQALRGADALAGWVSQRRGGAPIRGHAAAVAGFARDAGAGEFVQSGGGGGDFSGDTDAIGPHNVPTSFNFREAVSGNSTYTNAPQATLIEAGGAAARQASAAARATGPSASARANQAGAMARVLSVTDSPTGNMLPLVAPAAHAVVTAAAAKPQSEHIVTSGYGPSQGTSAQSMQGGGHGDGASHDQAHGEEAHGHDAQDVDALAAKIARSVMLRMQRERERRGQYG